MCCPCEIAHYLCDEVIHSNQIHFQCSKYYQTRKCFHLKFTLNVESAPFNRHPGKSRCIYCACVSGSEAES